MADPLEKIGVPLSAQTTTSLASLINSWKAHVSRLVDESTDNDVEEPWGAHDLLAALYLRDFIANSTASIPAMEREESIRRLESTDREFESFTEGDQRSLVVKFSEESGRVGWWWTRLPQSGPVRRELDEWFATLNLGRDATDRTSDAADPTIQGGFGQ